MVNRTNSSTTVAIGALSGQTALLPLPSTKTSNNSSSSTIIPRDYDANIPVQLQIKANHGSSRKAKGMDVIKVAEVCNECSNQSIH
jgi:hypothetical protein